MPPNRLGDYKVRGKKSSGLNAAGRAKARAVGGKSAPKGSRAKNQSAKRKPSQAFRGKKRGLQRSKSALKRVRFR